MCLVQSLFKLDLGCATRAALSKGKGISQTDIMSFRQHCRTCLQGMSKKLLENIPLTFPLTEKLNFFNPVTMAQSKDVAIKNLKRSLDVLLESNLLSASTMDYCDREYKTLVSIDKNMELMKNFSKSNDRLDRFRMDLLKQISHMSNLEKVVKLLLPLSHGNAAVERGFSVNGEVLVENLHEESLVAQRLVYDSVKINGGLQGFSFSKELILSMKSTNSRWKVALYERKSKKTREEREATEKRKAKVLLKELNAKKQKIITETQEQIAALEEKMKKISK